MSLWITVFVVGNSFAAHAQAPTNDAQARALEILRKTIAERESKPGKPTAATNTAAPSPAPAATVAPVAPQSIPADLEQQYLTGKITAKQFQKALEEARRNPPRPATTNDARVLEALRSPSAQPAPAVPKSMHPDAEPARGAAALAPRIIPSDPPKPVEPPPLSPAAQSQFTEVEKKMDELMRLKAEREKGTNPVPASAESAKPKTKRERLDDLLRLLINGKITDTEYKEQRDKVVAGPD